jgi:hypothetical protein
MLMVSLVNQSLGSLKSVHDHTSGRTENPPVVRLYIACRTLNPPMHSCCVRESYVSYHEKKTMGAVYTGDSLFAMD